jgi:tRNA pseudouridine55 synthase
MCVGSATRLAEYVQAMDKVYETTLVLGARSDTDDADGTIIPTVATEPIDEAEIQDALKKFVGEIEQTPPAYSAVKVGGQRAHELARRGAEVEIAPRIVSVYGIVVRGYEWPELALEVHCGKGTYIRSLSRDLGEALGCGAYLKQLRRTRVGPFLAADGISLDASAAEALARLLPPIAALFHLPTLAVAEDAVEKFRLGQAIPVPAGFHEQFSTKVAVVDHRGILVGVGCVGNGGIVQPVKVLSDS